MYAIISDSGRQIKVEQGQELLVDYRDVPAGEKVTFDRVLAVNLCGIDAAPKTAIMGIR